MDGLFITAQLDVYSISTRKHLRSCGKKCDLAQLGSDEYFTFSIRVHNRGTRDFTWEEACVSVDDGEAWNWPGGRLPVSGQARFRIAHRNMCKCMTPGSHRVVWSFDGQPVHQETFLLTDTTPGMDWESVFPFPSRQEIEAHQKQTRNRSPYLTCWMYTPSNTRYTEYRIDFRADHLPRGTYCSLANWTMDHSGLKKRYRSVHTGGHIHGYAGFQHLSDGRTASIMSFWDIFCTDRTGREQVLRPRILYPDDSIDGKSFTGEGAGSRCTTPFHWEANHWYRMCLKCVAAPTTTYVEQWVQDLETGEERLLCRYDTCIPDSAFTEAMGFFLENFNLETAGEIRSMEVRNAQYRDEATQKWQAFTTLHLSADEGLQNAQYGLLPHVGSYNFGITGNRIWMITSGAGGNWFQNGKGKKAGWFTIAKD